nr:MAG TPA: hypothetical protein [Caudoviricetes sp.]
MEILYTGIPFFQDPRTVNRGIMCFFVISAKSQESTREAA